MKKKGGRWPEDAKTPLARLRGDLTIEKAAVAMGTTSRTLQRYEHGDTDVPMKIAAKMMQLYCVSIVQIYDAMVEMWTCGAGKLNPAILEQ